MADFRELTDLKLKAGRTGLFMVGGGVPKNFAQDVVVAAEVLGHDAEMLRYAVQLTVADERDGALSGSTLREANSWGKVDLADEQLVFGGCSRRRRRAVGGRTMTLRDQLTAARDRAVVRRALKYAVFVGALLLTINHGDAILRGDITPARLLRMALTVMVPYCVSTLSSLEAAADQRLRQRASQRPAADLE